MAAALITAAVPALTADAAYTRDISDVSISSMLDSYLEAGADAGMSDDELIAMLSDGSAADLPDAGRGILGTDEAPDIDEAEAEAEEAPERTGKAYAAIDTTLNIRKSASTDADIVGHLYRGSICEVTEDDGEWVKITSGNCTGYVKAEYLKYGEEGESWIAANGITNIMAASTVEEEQEAAEYARKMEEEAMLARAETAQDETVGAASQPEATVSETSDQTVAEAPQAEAPAEETTEAASEEAPAAEPEQQTEEQTETAAAPAPALDNSAGNQDLGVQIAQFGLQFVGNPYVYGGSSLTNGCDCSGFTMAVYANYGIYIAHETNAQATYGREVSIDAIQPGDILFYSTPDGRAMQHAALYVGNGMIVHASSPSVGIITSPYNYRMPCKAIRLV